MPLFLRRQATFSAGLFQPLPSGDSGGHDYLCELTVGGEIDARTGMVVNIRDVDAVLKNCVILPFNGKMLDRDVPDFQEKPPSLCNIASAIWERCAPELHSPGLLARVTLGTTRAHLATVSLIDKNGHWHTGDSLMHTVTRSYDFSASHRLHSEHLSLEENKEIFGKCNWANGHGHNYEVEVTLSGSIDPVTGELGSMPYLDQCVKEEVLLPYDHKHLNYDTPEFAALNPTSENLTRVIWDKLLRRLDNSQMGNARLYKVVVRETARNYFEYYGE